MRPKKLFSTKQRMFGAIIYASQEIFTQPLVVMVETFRRSERERDLLSDRT